MLRQPAAQRGTRERAEELHAAVDTDRRALGADRCELRNQRRQRGLEQIESGEKHQQAGGQCHQIGTPEREQEQRGDERADRADEHWLLQPLALRRQHRRQHQRESAAHDREINHPVPARGQMRAQRKWHDHEQRHQHRMQRKYPVIEPQQLPIKQHPADGHRRCQGRLARRTGQRIGDDKAHHHHRQQRQTTGQRENAGHAHHMIQHRTGHH